MAQQGGVTATAAAAALFEAEKPSRSEVEKARRRLDELKDEGLLSVVSVDGANMYTAVQYNSFQVPGPTT